MLFKVITTGSTCEHCIVWLRHVKSRPLFSEWLQPVKFGQGCPGLVKAFDLLSMSRRAGGSLAIGRHYTDGPKVCVDIVGR